MVQALNKLAAAYLLGLSVCEAQDAESTGASSKRNLRGEIVSAEGGSFCSDSAIELYGEQTSISMCNQGQSCRARRVISTCAGSQTRCCSKLIATCQGANCFATERIDTCLPGAICCAPMVTTCLGACPPYPACLSVAAPEAPALPPVVTPLPTWSNQGNIFTCNQDVVADSSSFSLANCADGQTCVSRNVISTCSGADTHCCSNIISTCIGATCSATSSISTCLAGSTCCAPTISTCLGDCPPYPACMSPSTPNQLPPPTQQDCQDNDEACAVWAARSECDLNPEYMQQSCRMSCGLCDAGKCEDMVDSCSAWAAQDECTKNPVYMRVMCKASCGLCGSAAPSLAPTEQAVPTPAPTPVASAPTVMPTMPADSSPMPTPSPPWVTPQPTPAPEWMTMQPTPSPAWVTPQPTPAPEWMTMQPTPSPEWVTAQPTMSPTPSEALPASRPAWCSPAGAHISADFIPVCGVGQTCYASNFMSTCYGAETECCSGGVIAACIGAHCVAAEEITTCVFGSTCCAPRVLTCLGSCPSYPECLTV